MTQHTQKLNTDKILQLLKPNNLFAKNLKGFESRSEQHEMMRNVLDAYNNEEITLIEAGTGTGKSLAYLIPAMIWAKQTGDKTVISTNTIPLQEQLLNKDIPLIDQTLNLGLKAVLVKGMHNYICLRKFYETSEEKILLTPQETEEIEKIDVWKESTKDGSRASIPFSPSTTTWEKIAAENDTCNKNACPYFQQCFFFKARKETNDAHLLIVNHHLLFADLVRRRENQNYKDPAILPPYTRIILDEAHNIEDIATDYFASRTSYLDLMRLCARLATDKKGQMQGKLHVLKEKLIHHYKNDLSAPISSILNRLNNDLPGLKREILEQAHHTFNGFFEFIQSGQKTAIEEQSHGESKLRILPHHHNEKRWVDSLLPLSNQLCESLEKYAQSLVAIITDIKHLKNPQLEETLKGICFEINALSERLTHTASLIRSFATIKTLEGRVRWIELQQFKTLINTALIDANLNISNILVENLFSKFSTVILCSATLTTNGQFDFIRNRLGLNEEHLPSRGIKEYSYNSPFDFKKQALMGIPTDILHPTDPGFINDAVEKIWHIILSCRGNAFVLFTSYSMLKTCFEKLEKRLKEKRFNPLKQGDEDRQTLLNKFKQTNYSILFGTDSFWEGIDVAGEALRCVIIVKLPFKVPSDPLIQARSEAILAKGGDPFFDYSLPQAIVKFKQGFGRLIRKKNDRGCIICLDTRLLKKGYGQLFLNSLPKCQEMFAPNTQLQSEIKDFYKRTHFLTLKAY